ncbi:MAG: hypothetical protein IH987_06510 [Planctomycetes bacterium]|nr:hypothetical protein [Planctomycetota bacterium]
MTEHQTSGKDATDFEAAQDIAIILRDRDKDEQERILRWVSESLQLPSAAVGPPRHNTVSIRGGPQDVHIATNDRKLSFADRETLSPKAFLHEKQPKTDIERVACLAYFLAYYRDTPHFKTLDISKLNTEAAQLKFSNPAHTVANATKGGLVAPAGKGAKQISAIGERFVDALPNRDDAKSVLGRMRRRRSRNKPSNTKRARRGAK